MLRSLKKKLNVNEFIVFYCEVKCILMFFYGFLSTYNNLTLLYFYIRFTQYDTKMFDFLVNLLRTKM